MIKHRRVVWALLGLAAVIGLAGCAVSDATKYYALGSSASRSAAFATSAASTSGGAAGSGSMGMAVGVGPVMVPSYLDRGQIVIRDGTDLLELATFHRWAEPLPDGIARVLAEEISARVPTERVVTFPWRGAVARALQYQVVVAVVRFDGRPGGNVTLDARWRILGKDGEELAFRRSTLSETVAGAGHEPMVAAMTRTLLTLGQEIASEIRAMPR